MEQEWYELVSDATHHHHQGEPLAVWTIEHGLGKYPNWQVIGSDGGTEMPLPHQVSVDVLELDFGVPVAGDCYLS